MFMLSKNFSLIKPEYDQLLQDVFQFPILERQYTEINELIFEMKYIMKYHPEDVDRLAKVLEAVNDINTLTSKNWGELISYVIKLLLQANPKDDVSYNMLSDFYTTNILMDAQCVNISVNILSESQEFLAYLDDLIPDNGKLKIYSDHFYRNRSVSYNDAIESYFPEKFESDTIKAIGKDDDAVFVHNFTFQTSENCNLNCFTAGTPILMGDFTQKPIEEVELGDTVLGFQENVTDDEQRVLQPFTVTKLFSRTAKCLKLESDVTAAPMCVTLEHPFLTPLGEWIPAKDIHPDDSMMIIDFDPDDLTQRQVNEVEYAKGYLTTSYSIAGCRPSTAAPLETFISYLTTVPSVLHRMSQSALLLGFNPIITHLSSVNEVNRKDECSIAIYDASRWDMLYRNCYLDHLKDTNAGPGYLIGVLAAAIDICGDVTSDSVTIRLNNGVINSSKSMLINTICEAINSLDLSYSINDEMDGTTMIKLNGGCFSVGRLLMATKPAHPDKTVSVLMNNPVFTYQTSTKVTEIDEPQIVYNLETSGHTFIAGRFLVHNCTYCYQGNKTSNKMTLATGKAFVDKLLAGEYGYINDKNSPALIIEFIGGDPFLEMPLTRKIYEYFLERTYQLNHPWFAFHRVSLCSNGLLYFDKDVQSFFEDFSQKISFNISIDGNRELHDACRIQPNGEGSYDIDMAALKHYTKYYASEKNSKMTLAPSNIKYLFDSVVDFIGQGMNIINLNCIFEEGWGVETALLEYNELKRLADYLLANDLEHLFIAIFSDDTDALWDKGFDGNFCGGTGAMLSMGPDGTFYPCLRYMPSSIGDDCPAVQIGNVYSGMVGREQGSEILGIFDKITRRSQSTDICYNCPIGSGCAWCSANCHQVTGTANRRTTFHCIQTIAESLANVYYWNLLNIKQPAYNLGVRKNNVPDEWALKIISKDELEYLKAIENRSAVATIDHEVELRTNWTGG